MPNLSVIVCSVRVKRAGLAVGEWFFDVAVQPRQVRCRASSICATINLPVFDEPNHPRFQRYEFEHTKAWSAMVGGR